LSGAAAVVAAAASALPFGDTSPTDKKNFRTSATALRFAFLAVESSASRGGRWRCLRGGLARNAGRPVRAPLALAGGLAASGSRA